MRPEEEGATMRRRVKRPNPSIFVLGVLSIAEGLAQVLTLGTYSPNWRAAWLFGDWSERLDTNRRG
jgi:hypothetical protein